jgi:hypothetical protein
MFTPTLHPKQCCLISKELVYALTFFRTNCFVCWALEKTVGAHLSCKAYNCRVLISWLSSCYSIVVSGACVPNRFVGQWLSDTNQEWPEHELIAPTAEAMILAITIA